MKFVTLTNYRSGSSFFMRCLDNHPNIKAVQEILRRGKDRNKKFLNDFFASESQHGIVGFKLMYDRTNRS